MKKCELHMRLVNKPSWEQLGDGRRKTEVHTIAGNFGLRSSVLLKSTTSIKSKQLKLFKMKNFLLFLSLFSFVAFSSCEKAESEKEAYDKEDYDKDGKKKDGYKEQCFYLMYPVTYTLPDGTTASGNKETVWETIKAWYEANPDSEEKPSLNYPVEIKHKDGTFETIADEAAMINLKADCYGDKEMELCEWDEESEASDPAFEKITVKELIYSEDCGCYTQGFEKYLENGKTRFLIYYKSVDCVGYGYKVTCEDGDCDKGVKCKFIQECAGEGN